MSSSEGEADTTEKFPDVGKRNSIKWNEQVDCWKHDGEWQFAAQMMLMPSNVSKYKLVYRLVFPKTRPGSGAAAMKDKATACFGIVQAQQSSSDTFSPNYYACQIVAP